MNRSSTDVSSPWEWRRLKGEVISLRSRLADQEAIRRRMQEGFDREKKILVMRAEEDKQLIKQLEARLHAARQTVPEAREARNGPYVGRSSSSRKEGYIENESIRPGEDPGSSRVIEDNIRVRPKRSKDFCRNFSPLEQRKMVRYLIDTDSITRAKGHKIWQDLIANGQLTHRTYHSLQNNFRKSILPNIHQYEMEPEHMHKFLRLRRVRVPDRTDHRTNQ